MAEELPYDRQQYNNLVADALDFVACELRSGLLVASRLRHDIYGAKFTQGKLELSLHNFESFMQIASLNYVKEVKSGSE